MDSNPFPGGKASANGAGNPSAIPFLKPSQISAEQHRPYVVKGLIARGDHAIAMGQPGCGKSALVPYVAYAVAQGRSILGRRVKGGPVVYLAAEDGHGLKNRIRALFARHGDAPDFHLIPVALDLSAANQLGALEALIAEIEPVLIVIDTLAKSFSQLIENEGWSMGPTIAKLRGLGQICDAAVWTVHHVAKDGGTTPRGHGSLAGDADVTMLIEGSGTETRRVRLGKNRNGPSDMTFSFDLVIDELGTDDDGDAITAPVAIEAEGGKPSTAAREAKLSDRCATMLRTLRAIDPGLSERIRPEPLGFEVQAIRRKRVRSALVRSGWFSEDLYLRDSEDPILRVPLGTADPPRLSKSGSKVEWNALNSLKRRNFINFNTEWLWLI